MARKQVFGDCHICGAHTALTFEHVPPRAAFNDRPVVNVPFEKILSADDLDNLSELRGPQSQRGAGAYTLCSTCNNDTGAWYGNAFVDWTYQGLYLSDHAKVAPSLHHIFRIFPLRVIKQIACMFFSANHPGFNRAQEELVRFVLNREHKYISPKVKFYTHFNLSDRSRQSGISSLLSRENSEHKMFSEISFPPFGYVMSLDSAPPDDRLIDISAFANYGYNQWTDIALNIPILPVYTPFPGDYRSRDSVRGAQ